MSTDWSWRARPSAIRPTTARRDEAAKEAGFNAFVERLYPGRTAGMRGTTAAELKATTLMSMVIDEASAKIRAGGPLDLEADLGAACRAGTIPIVQRLGVAIPDPLLDPAIAPLLHLGHFAEGGVLPDTLLALRHDVR